MFFCLAINIPTLMEDVLKELIDWLAKNSNPLDFVLINISHCNGDDCESKTNNLLKKYSNFRNIFDPIV